MGNEEWLTLILLNGGGRSPLPTSNGPPFLRSIIIPSNWFGNSDVHLFGDFFIPKTALSSSCQEGDGAVLAPFTSKTWNGRGWVRRGRVAEEGGSEIDHRYECIYFSRSLILCLSLYLSLLVCSSPSSFFTPSHLCFANGPPPHLVAAHPLYD